MKQSNYGAFVCAGRDIGDAGGRRSTAAQEKSAPLLVMVSIDGLRPDYVTAADAHGAKVPNLRKIHEGRRVCGRRDGSRADGDISESHDAGDGRVAGDARDLGEHDV